MGVQRWLGLAAAAVVGGVMTFGLAAPAAAAEPVKVTPTTTPSNIQLINTFTYNGDEAYKNAPKPSIFTMPFSTPQLAYCIEFEVLFARGEHVESKWTGSGIENLGKVQWILTNGFPAKVADPAAYIKAAGGTVPADADPARLAAIAYVGTQAAIWSFTDADAFGLAPWSDPKTETSESHYNAVKAIYDYLRANAKSLPEVTPTLTIDPATATGEVGAKIGPYTVKAPAGGDVALKATGGKVVDANGKEITTLQDGGKFYLVADAAGTVTVDATGSYSVPTGRIFVHVNEGKPVANNAAARSASAQVPVHRSQKLILAGATGDKLAAKATATVKAKPTLPVTGASTTIAIASGIVLLGGGGLLVMAMRRRRVRFTA